MELESVLEKVGLSRQEAVVYLAALKLGVSKASQIAQKSKIRRGGVYYVLGLLKEKGFVNEVIKSGVQYYSAVSPERILEIIEEEKEAKVEAISSAMSELKSIRSTSIDGPMVEVYDGYEGFKSVFSKLLEGSTKKFRCYMSSEILEYLPHFHEQFRKRRLAKGIRICTITEKTPELLAVKRLDKKEKRETRFNDSLLKNTNLLHYILEDSIVIIKANKKEQSAMWIRDRNLAELQKNVFDSEWEKLKNK